jgi:hypothetical protein
MMVMMADSTIEIPSGMEIQPSMVGTMMVNRVTLEVHAP